MQRKLFRRIAPAQLDAALDTLLPSAPDVLLVHSSLSRCGYFETGPRGILSSLRERSQTLCLPTHTYCYTRNGVSETFDPQLTPSRNGHITNVFRNLPDVSRSVHPTHSLAACGPRSVELCAGHWNCDTACGEGTPYEKLVQWDAAVLMFGVTLNTYTLFHYAEHRAQCPYLYESEPYNLRARDYDGGFHDVKLWRQDMRIPRRFTAMRDELEHAGLLQSHTLGQGELLLLPSSSHVHAYTSEQLKLNIYHLVDRGKWNPPS